jgi:hypothetical protein
VLTGRRIVLGVTGGIAAYKAVDVCRRLVDAGAHVVPVLTDGAQRFVGGNAGLHQVKQVVGEDGRWGKVRAQAIRAPEFVAVGEVIGHGQGLAQNDQLLFPCRVDDERRGP